jgi:hypothetical protein
VLYDLGVLVDQLHLAVAQDLSSRYCPHSRVIFLTRFWGLFALFAAVALAAFFAARKRTSHRMPLYTIAGALLLFALGSGALVLYGLSGCSGAAAEGLNWDWP